MVEEGEQLRQFKADVLQRLQALGIPPTSVTIEYQGDLQDHHVLIGGDLLDSGQIEGILQTVAEILHVEFENDENARLYATAQMKMYAASGVTGGIVGGT